MAKDVCDVLGFTRLDNMMRAVPGNAKRVISHHARGKLNHLTKLLSEADVCKLIMRSDKGDAQRFQDWAAGTVLPAIRKDGSDILGEEKVATGEEILSSDFPNPLTEEP